MSYTPYTFGISRPYNQPQFFNGGNPLSAYSYPAGLKPVFPAPEGGYFTPTVTAPAPVVPSGPALATPTVDPLALAVIGAVAAVGAFFLLKQAHII